LLAHRFPTLRILYGDAEDLLYILDVDGVGRVSTIVSSLPRVGWSLGRQRRILKQCFSLLAADGVFLEFSYGAGSPVPGNLVNELSLVAQRLERLWANFPPATVWGYRRVRAVRTAVQVLASG
jgi:phosphatidylethanolamine/phosphatidyl-N-methylethanolamine N-methyltransferase